MIYRILILVTSFFLLNCEKKESIVIYSPDKSTNVRIEASNKEVLLFESCSKRDPSIVLDYSDVDLAGGIYLKWILHEGSYKWKVVFHKANLISVKLCCTDCEVFTDFPKNEMSAPDLEQFAKPFAIHFSVNPIVIANNTDLFVEY